jgi:hypothetical protein
MAGNLCSRLRGSARSDPMRAYDALPGPARRWLAAAKLPWSARSVARLWARALREERGSVAAVLARLEAAEQRLLAKDAPRVWGQGFPLPPLPRGQATQGFAFAAPPQGRIAVFPGSF